MKLRDRIEWLAYMVPFVIGLCVIGVARERARLPFVALLGMEVCYTVIVCVIVYRIFKARGRV